MYSCIVCCSYIMIVRPDRTRKLYGYSYSQSDWWRWESLYGGQRRKIQCSTNIINYKEFNYDYKCNSILTCILGQISYFQFVTIISHQIRHRQQLLKLYVNFHLIILLINSIPCPGPWTRSSLFPVKIREKLTFNSCAFQHSRNLCELFLEVNEKCLKQYLK